MKVIDFDTRGNVVRLYFGKDDNNDYWGDDWDDIPYEHNAGKVYDQYVYGYIDYAFPFDCVVMTPASDWKYSSGYSGGSPFSKQDMKKRKCPCVIIKKGVNWWDGENYSEYLGSKEKNVSKIYFNDTIEDVIKKITKVDGCIIKTT